MFLGEKYLGGSRHCSGCCRECRAHVLHIPKKLLCAERSRGAGAFCTPKCSDRWGQVANAAPVSHRGKRG